MRTWLTVLVVLTLAAGPARAAERPVGDTRTGASTVDLAAGAQPTQPTQPSPARPHIIPSPVTDDPAEAPRHPWKPPAGLSRHGLDGAGLRQARPSSRRQPAIAPADRRARDIALVGALQLEPANRGVFADVAGYRDLAFVGRWREDCPGTGVDIIDISTPATPVKLADTADHPDTSMEDMQAIRIGGRDVLAIGLQDCGNDPRPGAGRNGLELVDITDPRNPRSLSVFDTDVLVADSGGVHELDLTRTPGGRVLALLAVPDLEALTSDEQGRGGVGDLLIVDITNPTRPALIGEWGVLDEPRLGLDFYLAVRQGGDARTQLHSVRANRSGTLAYLSYWDAGVILLDISDPARPAYLGRTSFAPGEEGNAHSVDTARQGTLLVQADEDFNPFAFVVTGPALAGDRPATEAAFTPPIVDRPDRHLAGEVVHVGRGCPAGSIAPGSPEDPYLADPRGKIALIERGACRFDHKIARAQQAGAVGVTVYNSGADGESLVTMGGNNPATLPDGTVVAITIPAVFVQRNTGLLLRGAAPPVTARMAAVFNGWGFLRFFNITDPAAPRQLSTFATSNTRNVGVATRGTWSVHNPEVRGTTVYASWYNDGVRVIDIARPAAPQEVAFWVGEGAPVDAPAVDIWSVVPHGDLLLASDRNFGLYILRPTSRQVPPADAEP